MTSRARLATVSALGALLLLGTAGCGGGGAGPDASPTSPAPTSSTPTPTPTSSATDSPATTLLTKLATNMQAQGSARISVISPQQTVHGTFYARDGQTDFDVTMSLPDANIAGLELRVIDGVEYFSLPTVTGAGKFAKVESTSKSLGGLLSSLPGLRPGSSFATVGPAVKKLHDLGPATIAGVRTRHYLMDIDSALSHQLLNPGVKVPASASAKIPKIFEYNLYVTPDGLVRRVHFEISGSATTLDYTDWGTAPAIKAPPASALVATPAGF